MRQGDAMNKMNSGEMISALADGEVQGETLSRALQSLEADRELQFTWETYHLVGDVLRSADLAAGGPSAAFLARLRPAIAEARVEPALAVAHPVIPVAGRRAAAANDGRWKIAAGLASVAAVLAVGWNLVGVGLSPAAQPQLAVAPAPATPVLAAGERSVMLRDARLDELLAAHRQFGSPTAIPMPAGALRNAAFEAPAR